MKLYGGASRNRKRSIAALIAIVLIFCASVGGTIAYLVTNTQDVTNTFTPSDVKIEIDETYNKDTGIKSEIKVKNVQDEKNVPCYIRVKLVSNMQDGNGNVTGSAAVPNFTLNTTDWIEGDNGYYYYKHVVNVGALTNNLLAANSQMQLAAGQAVEVLAEGIQSVPANAVNEAWPAVQVNSNNQLELVAKEAQS